MKRFIYFVFASIFLLSCADATQSGAKYQDQPIDVNYQKKLLATKEAYPFVLWRKRYDYGLTQYTQGNCDKAKKVFDDLIDELINIGEQASEAQKVALFKKAILHTNKLNDQISGLIETEEREELCELTNRITIACGLDPHQYGGGEGLADEWRAW